MSFPRQRGESDEAGRARSPRSVAPGLAAQPVWVPTRRRAGLSGRSGRRCLRTNGSGSSFWKAVVLRGVQSLSPGCWRHKEPRWSGSFQSSAGRPPSAAVSAPSGLLPLAPRVCMTKVMLPLETSLFPDFISKGFNQVLRETIRCRGRCKNPLHHPYTNTGCWRSRLSVCQRRLRSRQTVCRVTSKESQQAQRRPGARASRTMRVRGFGPWQMRWDKF